MTCHKIILGHLNFCPKIYLMINLRTLSVNWAPVLCGHIMHISLSLYCKLLVNIIVIVLHPLWLLSTSDHQQPVEVHQHQWQQCLSSIVCVSQVFGGWHCEVWMLPVRHRGNSVCCSAGYGEGSWGSNDSQKSGYVTKAMETSLLNCHSDILQTAVAWDFTVADEVIPLDVEDATSIGKPQLAKLMIQLCDACYGCCLQELQLIQKTNNDWWSARRANGQEGYLPANYVKEIEPKVVQKVIKRPVKVPMKVTVEKTGVRKELRKKKTGLRRTPSGL